MALDLPALPDHALDRGEVGRIRFETVEEGDAAKPGQSLLQAVEMVPNRPGLIAHVFDVGALESLRAAPSWPSRLAKACRIERSVEPSR